MDLLHLGMAIIVFFGSSWFFAHSFPAKYALIGAPILSFVISSKYLGAMKVSSAILVGGLILFWVLSSGSYEHETKDGRADKRYKSNKYFSTFSDEFRKFSEFGLIGIIVEAGILALYKYFWH